MNELLEKIKAISYWYHRIELPDGTVTPGWAPICADKYAIPDDLTGKRVLDIGAWDGYWTWEALKRGAKEVVAIDDFSDDLGFPEILKRGKWETFDLCREAFRFITGITPHYNNSPGMSDEFHLINGWHNEKNQIVKRIEMSVYDISEEQLGRFDIVFFFGTIYHLKHPMLALEKISKICDGEIYIESAICDDYSPYRGGMKKGYPNNDMINEFYPSAEYGNNPNNWWVPTLQCLGKMVEACGFKNIKAWGLVDEPKELYECRGFVYGSKTGAENIYCTQAMNAENLKFEKRLKVAAVMSVPRLGFTDNLFCVFEGLIPYKIPVIKMQGAFWGQCLERGIQTQIDTGTDAVLAIDYDTVFTYKDVGNLIKLMIEHPEADAIVPIQSGRGGKKALLSMKSKSGLLRELVPITEFKPDLTKIYTGHFGLTLLRTSSLLQLPHAWFLDVPDMDGQWGPQRIDADIHFWRKLEQANMAAFSANRIVVGHLELVVTWPDEEFNPIYQPVNDYQKNFLPPENIWK